MQIQKTQLHQSWKKMSSSMKAELKRGMGIKTENEYVDTFHGNQSKDKLKNILKDRVHEEKRGAVISHVMGSDKGEVKITKFNYLGASAGQQSDMIHIMFKGGKEARELRSRMIVHDPKGLKMIDEEVEKKKIRIKGMTKQTTEKPTGSTAKTTDDAMASKGHSSGYQSSFAPISHSAGNSQPVTSADHDDDFDSASAWARINGQTADNYGATPADNYSSDDDAKLHEAI